MLACLSHSYREPSCYLMVDSTQTVLCLSERIKRRTATCVNQEDFFCLFLLFLKNNYILYLRDSSATSNWVSNEMNVNELNLVPMWGSQLMSSHLTINSLCNSNLCSSAAQAAGGAAEFPVGTCSPPADLRLLPREGLLPHVLPCLSWGWFPREWGIGNRRVGRAYGCSLRLLEREPRKK